MSKKYLNPDSLFPSLQSGFSQIVVAQGRRTVYISGQTAWNAERQIVGSNLAEQARQAFANLQTAVEAAGGKMTDVVALRIYVVNYKPEDADAIGSALRDSFPEGHRPASTWLGISSLADADFLIEIEATAVLE